MRGRGTSRLRLPIHYIVAGNMKWKFLLCQNVLVVAKTIPVVLQFLLQVCVVTIHCLLLATLIVDCELILSTLNELLQDKVLSLSTPQASITRESAALVLEWCSNEKNRAKFENFAVRIMRSLSSCIPQIKNGAGREKMWTSFHAVRTSPEYCKLWKEFVHESTGKDTAPSIFYQRLTDMLFGRLLHADAVPQITQGATPRLNLEETNGLRYAAGYIPRALRKKIFRSQHKIKDDILLCLQELLQDDDTDTNEVAMDESEEWVRLLDRGGLNHVTQNMYLLLVEMEYVIRAVLKGSLEGFKERAYDAIQSSECVRRCWGTISEEWDREESEVLFKMIMELLVTMRGFSFASDWIELYKIRNKKSVQKSKGKRKELLATKAESKDSKIRKGKGAKTKGKGVKTKTKEKKKSASTPDESAQKNRGLIELLLAKP